MSEMLKRVEAAVREADEAWFLANWPGATEENVKENSPRLADNYRACALAALKAMREPSDELLEIGRDVTAIRWGFGVTDARVCWEAVIDAALSTQPQERGETP